MYGKGTLEKLAKSFAEKVNNGEIARRLAKAAVNDAGEAAEYLATVIANIMLEPLYKGKDGTISTEWNRIARGILVDAILNILSGESVD